MLEFTERRSDGIKRNIGANCATLIGGSGSLKAASSDSQTLGDGKRWLEVCHSLIWRDRARPAHCSWNQAEADRVYRKSGMIGAAGPLTGVLQKMNAFPAPSGSNGVV